MSTSLEHQNQVNFAAPINSIRIQRNAATTLFDELKQSAGFIYDLGLKFGLSSKEIDRLKKKIDGLFISINESIVEASERIIIEIEKNAELLQVSQNLEKDKSVTEKEDSIGRIPYDELFQKYNETLNKNVELTAQMTILSGQYTELHEQHVKLDQQVVEMGNEKKQLEKRLLDAQDALTVVEQRLLEVEDAFAAAEQAKENLPTTETTGPLETSVSKTTVPLERSQVFSSSIIGQPQQLPSEDLLEKTKTADDFIEVFEKVFKSSDDLVQIFKYVSQGSEKKGDVRQVSYIVKGLEKSRHLRQVINDILHVFRKARINPSVLGEDVSAQVAEELKRIYETLKSVKVSTEKKRPYQNRV